MAAQVKETRTVIARQKIGITVDTYPRASPLMMFGAAPNLQDSPSS